LIQSKHMTKIKTIIFSLAALFQSITTYSQSKVQNICDQYADVAYVQEFSLVKTKEAKELLLDAISKATEEELDECDCLTEVYVLMMRDNRFKSISATHEVNIQIDTSMLLAKMVENIDFAVFNRVCTFRALATPMDTIELVFEKLREMSIHPHSLKSWTIFNGNIFGENLTIRTHREELAEHYLHLVKNTELELYLKYRLLVSLFGEPVKNPKIDSLLADLLALDHPLKYRIIGLMRTYGGEHSTKKFTELLSSNDIDSTTQAFIIYLPITFARQEKISKKSLRKYGRFLFENNLYVEVHKTWSYVQYLGEKNEKAFRRRYRKYLRKLE